MPDWDLDSQAGYRRFTRLALLVLRFFSSVFPMLLPPHGRTRTRLRLRLLHLCLGMVRCASHARRWVDLPLALRPSLILDRILWCAVPAYSTHLPSCAHLCNLTTHVSSAPLLNAAPFSPCSVGSLPLPRVYNTLLPLPWTAVVDITPPFLCDMTFNAAAHAYTPRAARHGRTRLVLQFSNGLTVAGTRPHCNVPSRWTVCTYGLFNVAAGLPLHGNLCPVVLTDCHCWLFPLRLFWTARHAHPTPHRYAAVCWLPVNPRPILPILWFAATPRYAHCLRLPRTHIPIDCYLR